MPRQNRVTPFSDIIATPARGSLMGNRGCLHNDQGDIKRLFRGKRWIICQLEFKGRQRAIMSPGKYTELFFLDEATALAAGHRPCAECSHDRFKMFASIWAEANSKLISGRKISVGIIDNILHSERIMRNKQKVTYQQPLALLPSGSFITLENDKQPYLVVEDALLAWNPQGYSQRIPRPDTEIVRVLTPRSTVRTLAQGYQAKIHPSAERTHSLTRR